MYEETKNFNSGKEFIFHNWKTLILIYILFQYVQLMDKFIMVIVQKILCTIM